MSTPIVENKMVKYPFSRDEQAEIAKSLARAHIELREVNGEFDRVKSQFKSRIVDVESKIAALSDKVNDGFEYRSTPCRVELFPKEGKKRFIIDTENHPNFGSIALEEQMTSSDYQLTMKDVVEAAEPSPVKCPAPEPEPVQTAAAPVVKRGRGRPRKNPAPAGTDPAPTGVETRPADQQQGQVADLGESVGQDLHPAEADQATAPEPQGTDPAMPKNQPAGSPELLGEDPQPEPESDGEPAIHDQLKRFVETECGFDFQACKEAAKGFALLTRENAFAESYEDLGERVCQTLLNAKRGFKSRMAQCMAARSQNPPEI